MANLLLDLVPPLLFFLQQHLKQQQQQEQGSHTVGPLIAPSAHLTSFLKSGSIGPLGPSELPWLLLPPRPPFSKSKSQEASSEPALRPLLTCSWRLLLEDGGLPCFGGGFLGAPSEILAPEGYQPNECD